jgi:hypothetical protein
MGALPSPGVDIELGKKLLREDIPTGKNGGQTQRETRKQIIDGACICLNIASTVLLIFLNKWYTVWNSTIPTPRLEWITLQYDQSLTIFKQDLPGLPIEEHANILRYVAFYVYDNRSMDSKPTSLQPLRPGPPSIPTNDTAVFLLRGLPYIRKPELGI